MDDVIESIMNLESNQIIETLIKKLPKMSIKYIRNLSIQEVDTVYKECKSFMTNTEIKDSNFDFDTNTSSIGDIYYV